MKKRRTKYWYKPEVSDTGWHKDLDIKTRRTLALKGHKGDMLATARSLQALANVTEDKPTASKARADARYFFDEHRRTGK